MSAVVYSQAITVLETPYTQAMTSAFASGTYLRFPIIALHSLVEAVPRLSEHTDPDITLLFLAMHLIEQQVPQSRSIDQTPGYVVIKQMIGLLETTSHHGLKALQARILVLLFELGHGVVVAASVSLGACTRTARAMGMRDLGLISRLSSQTTHELEESRRVWWGLFTLDRIINGYMGDAMFGMPDPKSTDHLPYADRVWVEESARAGASTDVVAPYLDSPFDESFGQFGRECQIAHLAGRVFRHVYDVSVGDQAFQADEAAQLEQTLWAFLPLLDRAELEFGRFCAALAMACK